MFSLFRTTGFLVGNASSWPPLYLLFKMNYSKCTSKGFGPNPVGKSPRLVSAFASSSGEPPVNLGPEATQLLADLFLLNQEIANNADVADDAARKDGATQLQARLCLCPT